MMAGFGWNDSYIAVTNADGSITWVREFEDLRGVVKPDVYEAIEQLINNAKEEGVESNSDECEKKLEKLEDEFLRILRDVRQDLYETIELIDKSKRLDKETLRYRIKDIYDRVGKEI